MLRPPTPLESMMLLGCGRSGGGAAFVGPLDALVAQGAVVTFAGSVRRLLSSYAGPSIRLRGNGAGSPEADIPFVANGDLDLTAAAAAAAASGGTVAFGRTWYDQGETLDATQATEVNQMVFSTAIETKGGFGDGTADGAVFFDLNLGTIPVPSFFLFVVNTGASSSAKILVGVSSTAANRYCRVSSQAMGQTWGALLAGTVGEVATGKHSLGYLVNDAASQNLLDGTSILTGDADNTQLDMSGGRIGQASSGTTNWLNNAGNSMSEAIVFGSNPTGLAGWTDFVTAQKAHFGIA